MPPSSSDRSPSKKKTRVPNSANSTGGNHSSNRLYFAFILSTFSLVAVWFLRDFAWSGPREAVAIEQLARLKLLVRIQTDLLDQALDEEKIARDNGGDDDEGNMGEETRKSLLDLDFLFLRSLQLRAMITREQLVEPKDRAIFDEFVVGVGRDVALLAKEKASEVFTANSKREMMKETALLIRAEVEKVAPDVYKTLETIKLVKVKAKFDEDSGIIDDEISSDKAESGTQSPAMRKVIVKTVVVDEEDGDGGDLDGETTPTASATKKSAATTSKKTSKSKKKKSKN